MKFQSSARVMKSITRHNPDLIKRDEEILIDYNVLRQEDVIPGECLRSLALEYELSPATIDDIVKGKTRRKKQLG